MIRKLSKAIPILLLLVLATGVETYSLAQYRSEAAGKAETEIARFCVSALGEQTEGLTVDCQTEASYTLTVTNEKDSAVSQVAVDYAITVSFSQAPPMGLVLALDDRQLTCDPRQTEYTFSHAGSFEANVQAVQTHTVKISADVSTGYDGTISFYVDAAQEGI